MSVGRSMVVSRNSPTEIVKFAWGIFLIRLSMEFGFKNHAIRHDKKIHNFHDHFQVHIYHINNKLHDIKIISFSKTALMVMIF